MNPEPSPERAAELERSRENLALEVERLREKKGQPRNQTPAIGEIFSVAEVMPEMIASMERQREKWAAFCEEIRPQFDALPETKPCHDHPTAMRPKLFEETCQRSRMDGEFVAVWAPCEECTGRDSQTKKRAYWRKRGVPERVLDSTLTNFATDTEQRTIAHGKVREWIKRNGVFLLLRGTPGTGKGHLAAGCLKIQGNGTWITHADMLTDLRASYTLRNTKETLAIWQEAECLVLDEFGLSVGGKDEETMLYTVLAKRYDERKPTVITTNQSRDEFRDLIGPRLLDRIGEDCEIVVCNWESWRAKKP